MKSRTTKDMARNAQVVADELAPGMVVREFTALLSFFTSTNNVFADETGHPLCVVGLFNQLRALKPHHFKTHGVHLFTLPDGSVLHRNRVELAQRDAAGRL